jgi:hypothetical protein
MYTNDEAWWQQAYNQDDREIADRNDLNRMLRELYDSVMNDLDTLEVTENA